MLERAKMIRLDYRGNIIDTCYRDYHSTDWDRLVSQGWITHSVQTFTRSKF
jgi:hypothetical protein